MAVPVAPRLSLDFCRYPMPKSRGVSLAKSTSTCRYNKNLAHTHDTWRATQHYSESEHSEEWRGFCSITRLSRACTGELGRDGLRASASMLTGWLGAKSADG